MIAIELLRDFLGTKTGRGVMIGVACVIGWFAFLFQHDHKIAAKAVATIEAHDVLSVNKAAKAGARSLDPSTPGMLSKYVRPND